MNTAKFLQDFRMVEGTVLEGSAFGLATSQGAWVEFFGRCVEVFRSSDKARCSEANLERVRGLQIGGPGVITSTSGGGWIGGGFGLLGAAAGIAMAEAMNAATTKTTVAIQTVLYLAIDEGELFLLNTTWAPDALRMYLSPAFSRLASSAAETSTATVPPPSATDLVEQLTQLKQLLDSGALSPDEYERVKKRLIDG